MSVPTTTGAGRGLAVFALVVGIVEATVEPILVPLPLAAATTLGAVVTVLLGWRERRRGSSPVAVPRPA